MNIEGAILQHKNALNCSDLKSKSKNINCCRIFYIKTISFQITVAFEN